MNSSIITSFDPSKKDYSYKAPGRSNNIKFSEKQLKFPKENSLINDDKKRVALHSFANHELLAVEIMAHAILQLYKSDEQLPIVKTLLNTIKDEQKHFKLYNKRMGELGGGFGEFPVNDFFWKHMSSISSFDEYFAIMSLTFEAANLDFANHYRNIFKKMDDIKTSNVLKIVFDDEISHVHVGAVWLNKWKEDKSLWEYYSETLPWPITPARSKGISYNRNHRLEAGISSAFLNELEAFDDSFGITKRKK